MTENLPAVITNKQYGIKDFEYVKDKLTKSEPSEYELSRPSFEFDNASKYHRAGFYGMTLCGTALTIAGTIAMHFLSGYILLLDIGATSFFGGITFIEFLGYKIEYSKRYSIDILKKLNIRPSLIKAEDNYDLAPMIFNFELSDKVKIISDLEQIRDQENEGLPVVTGGRIISSSGNHYRFEKDGKESGFDCANVEYSYGEKKIISKPQIVSKPHNLSKRVTPCTQDELKAYLDARMKSGDNMLIGGRIVNGSLQADLFRDENNKGAFDIYLKVNE